MSSPPVPPSQERAQAIFRLINWCRNRSPGFVCRDDLIQFLVDPEGEVQVMAVKDIPEDVTLMRVSVDIMFSQKNIRKKIRAVLNEIESKIVRFFESQGDFLGGDDPNEMSHVVETMVLAVGTMVEMADPESEWKPYWDSLPATVPGVFDIPVDSLDILEGSMWQESLRDKVNKMNALVNDVIAPILTRHADKLGRISDPVEGVKRAYGMWVSRQLKDEVQGRRAQYLVPVIDLINGEVEKRSNVIVDDAPRSNAGHMELDLKSTRPIEKGEQLFHLYDSCSNASFLQWYGFLSDSMAMGSPFHRSGVSPTAVINFLQEGLDASSDNAELKVAKRAVLGRLQATGLRVYNFSMSNPCPDELGAFLRACCRVVLGTAEDMSLFREIIKAPANISSARLLEILSPKPEAYASQGELLLATIDHLIARLKHGPSFKEDIALLSEAAAAARQPEKVAARMRLDLFRLRLSERTLFLRLRANLAKSSNVTVTPPEYVLPRICDNCGIFYGLKACSHCGNTAYCSRRCQLAKWKDHKRATALALKRQAENGSTAAGKDTNEVLAA